MRNSPSQGEIIRIKQLKMLWKRMKRGLSKNPDEWELEIKLPKLLELKEQEEKGKIDLRYLDESEFSLMPLFKKSNGQFWSRICN